MPESWACNQGGISIHTPVKGVTYRLRIDLKQGKISIHTPVKGVTVPGIIDIPTLTVFQSTHP